MAKERVKKYSSPKKKSESGVGSSLDIAPSRKETTPLEIKGTATGESRRRIFVERLLYQEGERFGIWEKNDPRRKLVERIQGRLSEKAGVPSGKLVGIDSPVINAFVVKKQPDIYVYAGLLEEFALWCERHGQQLTEDKLAMIIAHEMTHVEQGTEEEAGEDKRSTSYEQMVNQDRKNAEYDADRGGLFLMAKAGYNPREGLAVLEFLTSLGESMPLFATHPRHTSRLRELADAVNSPDTFIANVNKPPTLLTKIELNAITNGRRGQARDILYQRAGLDQLRELAEQARTIYDVLEVADVAMEHDMNAVAQHAITQESVRKMRAEKTVLHNIYEALHHLSLARIGLFASTAYHLGAQIDFNRPSANDRYQHSEFAGASQSEISYDASELAALEIAHTKDGWEKLKKDIEDTITVLEGGARVKGSILYYHRNAQKEEEAIRNGLRPTFLPEGIGIDPLPEEAEKLLLTLKSVREHLDYIRERVTAQTYEDIIANVDLNLDDKDFAAQICGFDGKQLLDWCSRNGTLFFGSNYGRLVHKKDPKSGGRIVEKDSRYERRLPEGVTAEEDLTTITGRRTYYDLGTQRSVQRRLKTYHHVLVEGLEPATDYGGIRDFKNERPIPVLKMPHVETIVPALITKLTERYTQFFSAAQAKATAEFVVRHSYLLEQTGYDQAELTALASRFSYAECQQVLQNFDRPPVAVQRTASALFQTESGWQSDVRDDIAMVELLVTKAVRYRLGKVDKLPTNPEERLAVIERNMRLSGDRSHPYHIFGREIVDLLKKIKPATLHDLQARIEPIAELFVDTDRNDFLVAVCKAFETTFKPADLLGLFVDEDSSGTWQYFRHVWDSAERPRQSEGNEKSRWKRVLDTLRGKGTQLYSDVNQLKLLEALFKQVPSIHNSLNPYGTKKEDAQAYYFGLASEYRLLLAREARLGTLEQIKKLLATGCVYVDEEGQLLGSQAFTKAVRELSADQCAELARFMTETVSTWNVSSFSGAQAKDSPSKEGFNSVSALIGWIVDTAIDDYTKKANPTIPEYVVFLQKHLPKCAGIKNLEEVLENFIETKVVKNYDLSYPFYDLGVLFDEKEWPNGLISLFQPVEEKVMRGGASLALMRDADKKEGWEEEAAKYDPQDESLFSQKAFYVGANKGYRIIDYFEQNNFFGAQDRTPQEKIKYIAKLVPEQTDFRDHLLVQLETALLASRGLKKEGVDFRRLDGSDLDFSQALELFSFYQTAVPYLTVHNNEHLWSRCAETLYNRFIKKGDKSFAEEIDMLQKMYPSASYARDEALFALGNSTALKTAAEAERILGLLFELQRRSPTEREKSQQTGVEMLSEYAGYLSRTERRDLLLWILEIRSEPPLTLRAIGGNSKRSVTDVPKFIFGATKAERKQFFIRLLYGENGLMDPQEEEGEKIFHELLDNIFDSIFPAGKNNLKGKGRQIVETVFKTVFNEYDAFRRSSLLISMIEVLKRGDSSSTGERLRTLLEELGPVFVKAGQVLSETENEPGKFLLPDDIRHEFKKLKQNVGTFHRTAAVQTLDSVGEFVKSDHNQNPIMSVEEQLAAASIKQVYRVLQADGAEAVDKVRRPSIAKYLADDIQVLGKIIEAVRKVIAVPEGLEKTVGRWVTTESDFTAEVRNHEMLATVLMDYERDRVVATYPVRMAKLFTQSTEHIREEYIRGVSLEELEQLAVSGPEAQKVVAKNKLSAEDVARYKTLMENKETLQLQILDSFLYQILRQGKFHSDPHAGNIRVTPQAEVVFIDAGSAGEVEPGKMADLRKFFLGYLTEDATAVGESLRSFAVPLSQEQVQEVVDIVESKKLESRDKFNQILNTISTGSAAVDEGFEKFLKALATGVYLSRGIDQQSILPSLMAYSA